MEASHRSSPLSRGRTAALAAILLGVAGCAGDGNLVRDVAMASGVVGSEPKPPPDFVARSRPASTDYLPIGTPDRPRSTRAKNAAAVGSAESEMEAVRRRNEARGAAARKAASP